MLEKTTTATTATERVALPARDVELGLEEAAGLACKHFRPKLLQGLPQCL
jgi:hypothetical protein